MLPSAGLLREVAINNAHPRLKINRQAVRRVIHLLDAAAHRFLDGPPPGELSLAFVTDAALAELHSQFLDDPTTTDVITFEGDSVFGTAGEVCVSADTAAAFAAQHGHDFSAELTLYIIHGWLHLAGYDDLEPTKKRRMRAAEARALKIVQEAEALPSFIWKASRA
ncbi:MAG: rRNA maturation RNase YbeY [Candidatus Synoicihabitans palmerolidicus]|nr:rRNA maturation RNase YbeY [Candidatus Synoicihabitans palmerolidicus]